MTFLIPGDLETRTGGYEYDRRIIAGLRLLGWRISVRTLDDSFPRPSGDALIRADATLASLTDHQIVMIDGLALGAMPDVVARHASRLRLVALVHHPLALETGLEPGEADRLRDSEERALAVVRGVVVTSAETARTLRDYDVAPERVAVVEPGTEPAPLARGSHTNAVSLLCVASLTPRKGHDVLFRALGSHVTRAWRLVCVGDHQRDGATGSRLRSLLQELCIADKVALIGETGAEETTAFYDAADVFVLPTLYEGYGMAVAEALARGLPVISTPTGGISGMVGAAAGLLISPGDVDGWAYAIGQALDPTVRARWTAAARARRLSLPTWEIAAGRMAEALMRHG